MRLLATGDLHLGRQSSLADRAGGDDSSAAAAWRRVVELACAEPVDALLIAGDLVDQENRYYEALGPLRQGLEQLRAAAIPVLAVAGNHDCSLLPPLVDALGDGIRLLGRGGHWEVYPLTAGDETIEVHGWSFPQRYCAGSLVNSRPDVRGDVRSLGLLHGDLDAAGSRYAPITAAQLAAEPVEFWILGHQHAPRRVTAGDRTVACYVGSPQALDAGEPDDHGVWRIDWPPGAPPIFRLHPLSTVRYQTVLIDLGEVATEEDWRRVVPAALQEALETRLTADCGPLETVSCRLRLTGASAAFGRVADWYPPLVADLALESAGVRLVVDGYRDETSPAVELAVLASRSDPPGRVARLLLELQQPEPTESTRELLRQATRRWELANDATAYRAVSDKSDPREVRAMVVDQAQRLLANLLAQENQG